MVSSYERMRELLSDRPVAFHPQVARLLGSINAGLLFQQLAYWSNTKADSELGYGAWIWKTQAELESETAMSRYEQEGARRILRRLRVVEEDRRGIPARLHYRINWRRFFDLMNSSSEPVRDDPAYKYVGDATPRLRRIDEQEHGNPADNQAAEPQHNAKSTHRDHAEKATEHEEAAISDLTEAESAWQDVAAAYVETGGAPAWFRAWCVDAELSGSVLKVVLPTSATVSGRTFGELVCSELYADLAEAWRKISGDAEAVLALEAG
jgi:hypothetical protein